MNFSALYRQLLRDLKASWQKTAVLVVLLLVGGGVWTYQIISAFAGKSDNVQVAIVSPQAGRLPSAGVETAERPTPQTASKTFTWQRFEQVLQSDPLVRSAEVAAVQSDPFHIDDDLFPPPVLFAEEPQQTAQLKPEALPSETNSPEGLVLKSTIVGMRRRAALINTRLYFEGSQIQAEGRVYRLTAVHPKKVILTDGQQIYELKIATSPTIGHVGFENESQTETRQ